jgi:hypothetical protein
MGRVNVLHAETRDGKERCRRTCLFVKVAAANLRPKDAAKVTLDTLLKIAERDREIERERRREKG